MNKTCPCLQNTNTHGLAQLFITASQRDDAPDDLTPGIALAIIALFVVRDYNRLHLYFPTLTPTAFRTVPTTDSLFAIFLLVFRSSLIYQIHMIFLALLSMYVLRYDLD